MPRMNKRGGVHIDIVIFFFLAVALMIFTLLSFNQNNNVSIEATVSGIGIYSTADSEGKVSQFYLDEASKASFVNAYAGVVDSEEYVGHPRISRREVIVFDSLNSGVENVFLDRFGESLSSEVIRLDDGSSPLRDNVEEKNVAFENGGIVASVDFKKNYTEENVFIRYPFDLESQVGFSDVGLNSFEEVYRAKEECKSLGDSDSIRDCFEEELEHFDASVEEVSTGEEGEVYYVVNLTSKNDFPYSKELSDDSYKVSFSFVLD